jgi:hypothetical protein
MAAFFVGIFGALAFMRPRRLLQNFISDTKTYVSNFKNGFDVHEDLRQSIFVARKRN